MATSTGTAPVGPFRACALLSILATSLVVLSSFEGLDAGRWNGGIGVSLAAIALGALTLIAWRAVRIGPDGIVPTLASIAITFMVGAFALPGLIVYVTGAPPRAQRLREIFERPAAGLWMMVLFWAIVLAVASCFSPRRRGTLGLSSSTVAPPRLMVAYGIGFVMSLFNVLQRGRSIDGRSPLPPLLQPFEQVFSYGAVLAYLAVAGFASRRDRSHQRTAAVMALGIGAIGMADGFFKPMLWAAVVYAIARMGSPHRSGRQVPVRLIGAALVIVGVALVFVVPVVQADRATSASEEGIAADLAQGYRDSWGSGLGTGWDLFVDKSLNRQAGVFAGLGLVVDRVPSRIEHRGVDDLVSVPTALVPRALWPSKPVLSSGAEISTLFYDLPSETRSSSSLLVIGDGYWYAGLIGVVAVAGAVGLVYGFVDTRFRSGAGLVVRIALIPYLVDMEDGVAQWLNGAVQSTVIVAVFAFLSSRRDRPLAQEAPSAELVA